ncbi:Histidine--tRNA ligase [Gossypium arboreum]|uniref:Histidine--tRNA ligase n=1 Tax=Gossypium arboreum TaxID=29729 RepID=A0A0B0PS47_GOSAR|nr:Histidine--tRNA ligase [Gossypium arboreum]
MRNSDLDRGKAKQCHQASIEDQGMSEASIILSPEYFDFGIYRDLNLLFSVLVGASKGGKRAW